MNRVKALPHVYTIDAHSGPEGSVRLTTAGVPELSSAAPAEFGGPGDQWSPEALLLAALADCFSLSFRASARASSLEWSELSCKANGTLDRVDGRLCFTRIDLVARLVLAPGQRADRAERLLRKAETGCPISASLATEIHLDLSIEES